MHVSGRRDIAWLSEITENVGSAFKQVNWGKEFEHIYDVTTRLKEDEEFTAPEYHGLPCFYSDTKFANHCVKVYSHLRKTLQD